MVKNLPATTGDDGDKGLISGWGRSPIHPGILAWRIPWTEEAGGIQSMGLQRAGHKIMVRESDNVLIFLTMAGVNFLKHLI